MGKVFPLHYSFIPNNIKGSIKNKDVRIIILKEIESERERKREREREREGCCSEHRFLTKGIDFR